MLSQFASKFDAIYCIHYLPFKNRFDYIQKILKDHGLIHNNFHWFFTNENKYFNIIYQSMLDRQMITQYNEEEASKRNIEGYIKNKNVFNLAINEYNLIDQIYSLGYERVLILEDDITFLKNKEMLKRYIDNYPFDYDIVSMEYWFRGKNEYGHVTSENRKINECFYRVSIEHLVNFSFVGLSRKGIKHWLDGMNQHFMNSDYYISNQNTYDDWRLKRCISKIPLCIQKLSSESNHTAGLNDMIWKYDRIKTDIYNYDDYLK